jgi:hypothetical protein
MTYREWYIKKVLDYAKEHRILGFTKAQKQMEAEELQEHIAFLRKMDAGTADLTVLDVLNVQTSSSL